MLRDELGNEWNSRLKEFDSRPLAAASIGQVHRGVLHDDREVAIKVQARIDKMLVPVTDLRNTEELLCAKFIGRMV